jgi:hypothetical protein
MTDGNNNTTGARLAFLEKISAVLYECGIDNLLLVYDIGGVTEVACASTEGNASPAYDQLHAEVTLMLHRKINAANG